MVINDLNVKGKLRGLLQESPKDKEQKERLDTLRREYIRLYTERDAILTYERDNIYYKYMQLIGHQKYCNFCLWVEVHAMKMKIELIQAKLNHNQYPDLDEIDEIVTTKLKDFYDEMEHRRAVIEAVEQAETLSAFTVDELKGLYRTLVRRLHPDLHPDIDEEHQDLFVKGVAAYRSYDIDLLREIVKRLEMDSPLDDIIKKHETAEEAIARIEGEIEKLRSEIDTLRASFPLNTEAKMLDPVWLKEQQDNMEEERISLKGMKDLYNERLELITGL